MGIFSIRKHDIIIDCGIIKLKKISKNKPNKFLDDI